MLTAPNSNHLLPSPKILRTDGAQSRNPHWLQMDGGWDERHLWGFPTCMSGSCDLSKGFQRKRSDTGDFCVTLAFLDHESWVPRMSRHGVR